MSRKLARSASLAAKERIRLQSSRLPVCDRRHMFLNSEQPAFFPCKMEAFSAAAPISDPIHVLKMEKKRQTFLPPLALPDGDILYRPLAGGFCYTLPMTTAHDVIVYSRRGCHLCEIVKETLSKLERHGNFKWREVDVDSNDDLRRQFTDEVPVIFIDGKKAFKYRMPERDFLRRLEA